MWKKSFWDGRVAIAAGGDAGEGNAAAYVLNDEGQDGFEHEMNPITGIEIVNRNSRPSHVQPCRVDASDQRHVLYWADIHHNISSYTRLSLSEKQQKITSRTGWAVPPVQHSANSADSA